MTPKRLWHTIMLNVQRNGYKRANYLREHNLFRHIGEKVYIQGRKLPLYSELISLGDNVKIASRVNFVTHSIIHSMLNSAENLSMADKVQEQVGCIEVGDNVFIGAGTTILSNVRIGSNVIVAAGSVITKDVPSNSVVGGYRRRL
jgi:acetyltransferase-like isoleucine patch superfamily enzyme